VKRYIVHPSYDILSGAEFEEHDVALIQLSQPAQISQHVDTLCLPPLTQEPVGAVCTVTGWGRLEEGVNEYPELLHKGDVPLVSHRYYIAAIVSTDQDNQIVLITSKAEKINEI